MERFHAVVSGLVQGVGFRYFVLRRASACGLGGYVKNLVNGDVEVVAEGEHDELTALLGDLRVGPSSAMVRDVRVEWLSAIGKIEGFQVL
jgi:acylphosphatase